MARTRFQRGQLFLRGKKGNEKWVGRWREDVLVPVTSSSVPGAISAGQPILRRIHRTVVLGTLQELPTKKLAQRELEKHLDSINSVETRPRMIATFGDFSARWIETVLPQHKPSSQNAEKAHMQKHIVPFFKDWKMGDITPALVQQFVSSIKAAPKTVRNIYATFRSAWKTARLWGYVDKNACEGIVLPRLNPVERRAFTVEEMQKIIQAAEEPFKTFFWLASETGMRIGELCGIRWEDIDLSAGRLSVWQSVWNGEAQSPKSATAARSMALSAPLVQHLKSQVQVRTDSVRLVFHTRAGRPWDPRYVLRDNLHRLCDSLGIPRGGMHAFRHGNATALIAGGADVKTVAARLGHSDPSITLKVYAHALQARDREVAEDFGKILCPIVDPSILQPTESATISVPNSAGA